MLEKKLGSHLKCRKLKKKRQVLKTDNSSLIGNNNIELLGNKEKAGHGNRFISQV